MRKIGKSWTKRMRRIDGRKRLVKVRKIGGREQIRIPNVRNLVDSSARRLGHRRKARYYSSTDSGMPKHRIHRR